MSPADRPGSIGISASWLQTWPQRYGFALLVVGAATLLRYTIDVAFGVFPPFVLFFPAIILVALLAGFGPGVFATLASAASVGAFFWKSINIFWPSRVREVVGLVLFSAIGTAVSALATSYRRHDARLREFERVVEGLDEMIVVVDRNYRYLIANQAFLNYRGMTKEQVIGRHPNEVLNPGVFESTVKPKLDECFQGKLVQFEMRYQYPTRGERDVLITYFPIPGRNGIDRVASVIQDISGLRKAEEQVRESEDRYRDLVEHSEDLVCTHDLEGRLISVNPAPARVLGYEVPELLKIPMRELIAPEFRAQFDAYLDRIRRNSADRGLMCVLTRSGQRRIWEYSNTLRTEGVPGPVVRGIAHDVTDRMRAESAMRASEERYRTLFEKSVAGVAIASMEGEVLDCNEAWARILGYDSPREIKGRNAKDFYFNPSDRPQVRADVLKNGFITSGEIQLRRKDGTPVWLAFDCCVQPASHGGPQVIQATAIDMTERKRVEEEMRRSEERFRVALKDSPITVFNQDTDLRYTWIYNPQLDWHQDGLGKTDEEIIGVRKAAPLSELKTRVLKTGAAIRQEVAIPHDGFNSVFDMTVEPLFDLDGNVVGITGACIDIARLRELTDRLQDAKDRLTQEKSYLENEIQTELGFEEIIGQSSALRDVLKKARVVAPTDSTVLLLGETGTGKELVARSVHSLSSRRGSTFVKLNCAAVPSGLLESELFGHEKGAFTGAVNQKVGRIELADKGTLFLDEIGELPPELQPKLLRVLQDREFERLGGVQTLHVDVRIIAATNRDLHQHIAEKKFREDLYYRLNVFPIELPPLRDRRDDIPVLVHHFVRKHAGKMGKHIEVIPEEAMQVLKAWDWPGNIRELENMIERMVILTKGRILASPPAELTVPEDSLEDNLTEMEREHIIRVLRDTHGVLSGTDGAANRLGIKRTTLQSMLKRFGIEAQDYRRGTGTFGRE